MRRCCVPFCKSSNRNKGEDKVSLHQFPSDIHLRMKWLTYISRDLTVRDNTVVCGKHFTPEDYAPGKKYNCLKKDAFPTIFPGYPKYKIPNIYNVRRTIVKKSQKKGTSDTWSLPKLKSEKVKYQKTALIHAQEVRSTKSQELPALDISKLNAGNFGDENSEDAHSEEHECQISKEITDCEHTSDSEEETNENLLGDIFHLTSNSFDSSQNAAEYVKRKLVNVIEHYEKAQKNKEFYVQKCKLYEKKITALKEVLNCLQQINSVSDNMI